MEQLEKTKIEMEEVKAQMEEKKKAAEEPEKEAKDKHEEAWKGCLVLVVHFLTLSDLLIKNLSQLSRSIGIQRLCF